jgi:DNA-binding SARP family transcriptional activator/streptogramin lyase
VEWRILGELHVAHQGRTVEIGAGKERALFAMLLLHRNEAVSPDRLADGLWGEAPPAAAAKSIQTYVSRLRKRLPGERLATRPAGYVLRVEDDEFDAARFERMLAQGRTALAAGDATAAAEVLADALALWRGPALADFRYELFAQAEITRLEELRLAAQMEHAEAELALGRHDRLVPRLQALVGEHPLQERLRGQLMVALYRSGRQSEALECYREGRRILVDELGIEPGPSLQELQQAILRQDARVAPPASEDVSVEEAEAPVPRTPARLVLGLALLVAAIVPLAAFLVARRDGGAGERAAPRILPRSLVAIDLSRGAVAAVVPLGALPGPATGGVGRIWVGTGARVLVSIDPHSRRIVDRIGLPAPPHDLAAGDGILWIANDYDGTVSRLDERVGFVSRPFRPEPRSTGRLAVATGFGSLWAGSQDGVVARIDPTRDRLIATIRGVRTPHALAVGEGAVWLVEATRAAVVRIDPRANRVAKAIALGALPVAVAVGGGSVWVATSDGRVWRVDPRANRVRATITAGGSPSALAATGRFVWVADALDGMLRRIDSSSNEVTTTVELGRPIGDLVQAGRFLWATIK